MCVLGWWSVWGGAGGVFVWGVQGVCAGWLWGWQEVCGMGAAAPTKCDACTYTRKTQMFESGV